jgi:hypothetical protein
LNFLKNILIVIASIGLVGCGYTIARQEAETRSQLDRKLSQIGLVQDTNDVSFWNSRIALVQIGMSRALVHHILPQKSSSTSFDNFEKDGTEREFYWLDKHWAISLRFDDTGKSYRDSGYDKNLLVEMPKLIREDFRSFMKK